MGQNIIISIYLFSGGSIHCSVHGDPATTILWLDGPEHHYIYLFSGGSIPCSAHGDPAPTISWLDGSEQPLKEIKGEYKF